jgi:pimeloyl-ACP methyl ester carboxylesterase
MKICSLLFLLCSSVLYSNYFDPSFLIQYDTVKTSLKNEGFEEVYFKTQDNLELNGLLYVHPKARANIVCLAGWYPGRKETLAPFFSLFGDQYNILLVDARGHGISQGPLFTNAWHYGINDYHDPLAALEYMHSITKKPTFIIGLCAGAFNATHAAIKLGDQAKEKKLLGIVFDSGWASVYNTSYTAPTARMCEQLSHGIGWVYGIKPKQAQDTILWGVCSRLTTACLYAIHTTLFKPAYIYYDSTTDLAQYITKCQVPLFFIHSYDDMHAPIQEVKQLACKAPVPQTWWIDQPSKHAGHHLKHTDLYKEKVSQFFDVHLDH